MKPFLFVIGVSSILGAILWFWRFKDSNRVDQPAPQSGTINIAISNEEFFPRFTVNIVNNTPHPQRIWKMSNSWGSKCLGFDFYLAGTDTPAFYVERKVLAFSRNMPEFVQLPVNGSASFEIDLSDDTWYIREFLSSPAKCYDMRCWYKAANSPEAKEKGVVLRRLVQAEPLSLDGRKVLAGLRWLNSNLVDH